VESHLKVKGFTELVFEGHDPKDLLQTNDEAWLSEAMVESLQGMLWSGKTDYEQFNNWVNTICEQRQVPAVRTSPEDFLKLENAILETTEKWESLLPGESIEFNWL
jgi:hypothetical protein